MTLTHSFIKTAQIHKPVVLIINIYWRLSLYKVYTSAIAVAVDETHTKDENKATTIKK